MAAVSIILGAAACGSDEPGAERSDPVLDTAAPDTAPAGVASSAQATPAGSTTTAAVGDTSTAPMTTVNETSDSTTTVVVSDLGISEAEVAELEQQLDEIDRVLADIEAQLAQD